MSRPTRRPGFTLLEMIGSVVLLGIAVGVGSLVLVHALRLQRQGLADVQRQSWRSNLADEFRSDVAAAGSLGDKAEVRIDAKKDAKPVELQAGPAVLILERKNKDRVIYRWHDGKLERIEVAGGQVMVRNIPAGAGCLGADFLRSGPQDEVIVLRLTDAVGKTRQTRSLEIAAVLGGDLR